jgi:hypothetical protein
MTRPYESFATSLLAGGDLGKAPNEMGHDHIGWRFLLRTSQPMV